MVTNWYLYFFIVYIILSIPKVNVYFAALNTMFHEMGHAVVCLCFQGRVKKISLFPNTEGEIIKATGSWLARLFISYAGYTFSPLVAYLSVYLVSMGMYTELLYGLIAVATVNLLLWVRNLYGVFWLVSFSGLCFSVLYFEAAIVAFVYFVSALLVIESVRSAFIIFLLSFRHSKNAGDATQLAKSTMIPAFVWGTLFFAQSLVIAVMIFQHFIF